MEGPEGEDSRVKEKEEEKDLDSDTTLWDYSVKM